MAIVVILILGLIVVGLYFLNKKTGIFFNIAKPRPRTLEELKKDAEDLKKLADEFEERANYIDSIRQSKYKIAKAKARINPSGRNILK